MKMMFILKESYVLSQGALRLWEQAASRDITILTPHWIPTEENSAADFLSRHNMSHWEIMLDREMFSAILEHFNLQPMLDVFTSQSTAQLSRFMSWERDPQAVGQDAMIQPWDPVSYLFPPVPLLPKVIRRIKDQGIRAILVCPRWPSALWWGLMTEMMMEPPLKLPYYKRIVRTLNNSPVPYLDPLVALHISGKSLTLVELSMI